TIYEQPRKCNHMNLPEQLVLVTGGARGLGRCIVEAFASEGSRIVINYRESAQAAEELAATIGPERAVAIQADITDPVAVGGLFKAAQEHFKTPVTTVVNNALVDFSFNGDARLGPAEVDWNNLDIQLTVSLRVALNTVQAPF